METSARQLESRCSELKEASSGHEQRAKEASAEVAKGNHIIEKLTADLQNNKEKLKRKQAVLVRQVNVFPCVSVSVLFRTAATCPTTFEDGRLATVLNCQQIAKPIHACCSHYYADIHYFFVPFHLHTAESKIQISVVES